VEPDDAMAAPVARLARFVETGDRALTARLGLPQEFGHADEVALG